MPITHPDSHGECAQDAGVSFAQASGIHDRGKLVPTIMGCYRAFRDLDATLLEINPLVITKQKAIVALDAKMSFDENALYRRPQIAELPDKSGALNKLSKRCNRQRWAAQAEC